MRTPHFDPIEACREIADRYRRYLRTMFYFRDPELRTSFERALDDWELVRGPYLEATPVYRRVRPVSEVLRDILGEEIDPGFARAASGPAISRGPRPDPLPYERAGERSTPPPGRFPSDSRARPEPVPIHVRTLHRRDTGGCS